MQITWEGKDIIKIVSERNTIVINADKKSDATVLLSPVNEKDAANAFVISNPGEYEVSDDFFYADLFVNKEGKRSLIYKLNIEDVNIVVLNKMDKKIELGTADADVNYENIIDNKLDILIIPIGEGFLDTKEALSIKNELSPRIVIAINYDLESEKDIKKFHDFKSSFTAISEPQDKFKVSKKNLPGVDDEMTLVILNKTCK